ncbi:tyrosine--tRNA ligase [bacterium]|nr:tyrosine--tRNA ligase [bacterium]MBU1983150.1 tyrosine--tRNA ligase [bacterium]
MTPDSVLDHLNARGLLQEVSNAEALRAHLNAPPQRIYIGFDPTGDTLHVGHLLQVIVLSHLQKAGHQPIILIGSATGMIGDPSGRSSERLLLTPEIVAKNAAAIRRQITPFIRFDGPNAAITVDNADWTAKFSFIDWLRDVGKFFTVNYMMQKESVRARLEDRDQGISYTEFSYMLLQANDFLHLYDEYGCRVEGGGNDQWGNITAGIDLIRKKRGLEAYGMTCPLVTTSSGEKFGKSAGNAIWLDPNQTSPYQFYQYWIRSDDRDVQKYLKMFTFLSLEEIGEISRAHEEHPEKREGQRILAEQITKLVHGEDGLRKAQAATEIFFGKEIVGLTESDLRGIFSDVPSHELPRSVLDDTPLCSGLLAEAGVFKSKGEAKRMIQGGGVYLNNRRITEDIAVSREHLATETTLVVRTGKANYHLIRFIEK